MTEIEQFSASLLIFMLQYKGHMKWSFPITRRCVTTELYG